MNSAISCLLLIAIVAIFTIGLSLGAGATITRDEITDSDRDENNVANVAARMVMHLWNQNLNSRLNNKRGGDYGEDDTVMVDDPVKRRRPGCVYDIWKGRGLSRCT
uniref:Somatostatin 2 n=1 Tax=Ophionotus victoriae TaxID=667017 RepID=A0A220W0B5_9ECHI|nr:somatostatin 2 precursor [Ophionotus victoriae]